MELVSQIIFITELIGVIAFAVSGAMLGIEKKLDLFGVMVFAVTTACGGGVVRDILLGVIPPMMFRKSIYLMVALISSIAAFCLASVMGSFWAKHVDAYNCWMNFLDALGLGVFAATSVNTVMQLYPKSGVFMATFMGTITAVGGGAIRDTMANQIPLIFRKRIYAIAAIIGSVVHYYMMKAGVPAAASMFFCIGSIVVIRILAAYYRWNLPKAPEGEWLHEKDSKDMHK
ncbi:trimeric intracellular cation channel family protein [Acetivibrio ethanolgignens]|uniref:Glycine transporter domain-containing protein n=1 Tax=Acetivibrio ethanolgignens TaxID=290052 RepID=A0A0V8QFV9_9FIRM|nr:trimeric intracellular cation channel family protein [Acetivibrio ethanolgignens]KSV59299.1 hypothetical protein ASU35_09490 [Acetivibrio ethanolgignens]